jgi:hypothetical protein
MASTGITARGTVTYRLFANGACAGMPSSTQTLTLSGGVAPRSSSTGRLSAGGYSFDAAYSGDHNYTRSTATCEPFAVGSVPSTAPTTPRAPVSPITKTVVPVTG